MTSLNLYVKVIDTPLPEDPQQYLGVEGEINDQSSMMVILIGAGVGGVGVLLLLIIVLVVILRKKRRKNRRTKVSYAKLL